MEQQSSKGNPSKARIQSAMQVVSQAGTEECTSCGQADARHKEAEIVHHKQFRLFSILYTCAFASLLLAMLITQTYILLPIIKTMAEGFVGALYYLLGVRAPKAIKYLMTRHQHDEESDL